MNLKAVLSSHVLGIGFDSETSELHVRYAPSIDHPAGPVYVYDGVAPETWEKLDQAPSIGAALHNLIRGRYRHRRL